MNELSKMPEGSEVRKPEAENFKDIKPISDMSVSDAKSFVDSLFGDEKGTEIGYPKDAETMAQMEKSFQNEVNDDRYTNYKDRLDRTPTEKLGVWEGERGESKFIPNEDSEAGRAAKEKLAEYGQDGVDYKNAEADFSQCSEATVEIDDMDEHRWDYVDDNGNFQLGNFSKAEIKCAEQWSAEEKDGRTDWSARDIRDMRTEKDENGNPKFTLHECCDTKTMQLVPYDIHSYCKHSGGVAECKARDNNGGGFDE